MVFKFRSGSKIAIGWAVVISLGLGSFVIARDDVIKNRRAMMEARRKIKDQADKESAELYEQRDSEKASV